MFTQSNLGKTVDCIEKYYKCGLYYLETRDNVLMFFSILEIFRKKKSSYVSKDLDSKFALS